VASSLEYCQKTGTKQKEEKREEIFAVQEKFLPGAC